jgi:phosphoglucomutase
MSDNQSIQAAVAQGKLLNSAAQTIEAFRQAKLPQWASLSIDELIAQEAWQELNDRFYRFLEFGTGGMRGRTMGVVKAKAETGTLSASGSPDYAAIGSNMLNDFTLIRAVIGLYRYTAKVLVQRSVTTKPRIVIAYDVRHFSKHFCELAASTWVKLGGDAFIFTDPRPTPQLSFSVRWLGAHAGVVITASHNPPHDNGFKAYFDDGAQVVPPHDTGIVKEVDLVPLNETTSFLIKDISKVTLLSEEADKAYLAVASQSVLDTHVIKRAKLSVIFTNIHGTGGVHGPALLKQFGALVKSVPEQAAFDPNFPTVKSPNPENAEALSRAVALAEKENADLVLATDPDDDRMGCAVRNRTGKMELLTGNQVGALLVDYRLTRFKELGIIPKQGSKNVCIIKTFVTTSLQDAIGHAHGVKVINTLTGFKWIASKMRAYEVALQKAMGPAFRYDEITLAEKARLHLEHSTFFAFGNEESYGYLPNDLLRDKDGNAACLMFAELASWVKDRGLTVPEYLDQIYLKYGFYLEGTINLYYEGASGNAKIKRIIDSYRSQKPQVFGSIAVTQFQDFGREVILDADGDQIPKQDLYVVSLANGATFAARGSGTEPKMKFYLFAQAKAASLEALPSVKASVKLELEQLKALIESDARLRAES